MADVERLFSRLVEGALFATEAELGYLLLAAEDGSNRLIMRAQKNLPASASRRLGGPFDDGLSPLVVRSGEPLQIAGEPLAKVAIGRLAQAVLAVPIKVKDKVVGVIVAGKHTTRAFGDRDSAMLSAIADYASIALVNSRLFHEVESRARAIQRAYDELRSAQERRAGLARDLSRELSAPLIQARGNLELLGRGDYGVLSPEQAGRLKTVLEGLTAAIRRVESMGAVSATLS